MYDKTIHCKYLTTNSKLVNTYLPRETDVGLDGPSAHDVGRERLREEATAAAAAIVVAGGRVGDEEGSQEAQPRAAGRPHRHRACLPFRPFSRLVLSLRRARSPGKLM